MKNNKNKKKDDIKKEDKKKENIEKCECKDNKECTCGEECNCGNDCKCEEECNCDDNCKCGSDCHCNEDKINELEERIKLLESSLLREKAEVANYKRRKDEEVDRILKYKNEDILKEYLPVIDNFERAIKMDDNDLSDEVSKFLEGFKIIYTNTLNLLNKFDVKEIDADGLEFDPTYHHAVLTEHDDNKPAGVVLEVLQKGYMYKDKVIRPAMVKVNE